MNGVLQTDDIIPEAGATCRYHDVDSQVLSEGLADLGCLHGKLSGGDEYQALDLGNLGIDLLEGGDDEGSGLAGSVLCTGEDVTTG